MLDVRPPDEILRAEQESLPVLQQHTDLVPWSPPQEPNVASRVRLILLLLCITVLLGCATLVFGEFLWSPTTATVIITPRYRDIQAILAVSTPSLQLSSTITRRASAAGTGVEQQQARPASGMLTFYNIATFPQTIPAGSIVVTRTNGVAYATDATVTVQAGNPPAEASVDVGAHALSSGTMGNISPGAIGMIPCCANIRLNGVVVNNTYPFTGGQEAATFTVVDQRDIDASAIQLEAAAQQAAQTSIHGQIPSHLQLLPSQCAATVRADPPVGSRSAHTTVTVTETCRGKVYNQNVALQAAIAEFVKSATREAGLSLVGYRLLVSGTQITNVSPDSPGGAVLACTVQVQGRWLYQFGLQQIASLKQKIAGLTYTQARAALQHALGIRLVTLSLSGGNILPLDASKISVIVTPLM